MNRRQLLSRLVQGFTATGAVFLAYPFVKSFMPTFKQDLNLEVDLSSLKPGESKIVPWLGRNVMIRRRRAAEIEALQSADVLDLKDPDSDASEQPAFARNVYRSRSPEWFVMFNNCTHLGCEVANSNPETEGGFHCPCHQSDFDAAGRVKKGAAAPSNLEVPHYQLPGKTQLRLIHVKNEDSEQQSA